ncbi:MAG: DUF2268 domain-containing putative Zn-dependent protease [Bacteroidota bacterium]
MKKQTILATGFLIMSAAVSGQGSNVKGQPMKQMADSLVKTKQYDQAARVYLNEAALRTMVPYKMAATLNASRNYLKAKMPDSAMRCLSVCIKQLGYVDLFELENDSLFSSVRTHPGYKESINYLRKVQKKMSDPAKAKIVISDIDLFWKVYDKYLKDTVNAAGLFVSEYFEKGTWALQDYYRLKTLRNIGLKTFVSNMANMRNYYKGIRGNTLKVAGLTGEFRAMYKKLKTLYPAALFPTATFLIGGWSSGGTRTNYGAIVGADMYARDSFTVINELNPWQKANSQHFSNIKYVFAHELIHAQQDNMKEDTILLASVIIEGMADFIGELLSGKTANERLHSWAKGKERKIWDDFKKEMYLDRYSNWIANSNQERPDHPADLGYWVGYQICKAYYDETVNKKQAIYDMLNIKDYKDFFSRSKYEEKMEN